MKDKDSYYREMRGLANGNLVRSSTSLDHIIFVATTGALVLASGLVNRFQNPALIPSIILAACIVSLLAALLIHSVSYRKSIQYNKLAIQELDQWYEGVKNISEGALVVPFDLPKPNVKIDKNGRTTLDNWAFGLMWTGIILLTIFIISGIIKSNDYGRGTKTEHARHQISR